MFSSTLSPGLERIVEIDPHQRVHDGIVDGIAVGIGHGGDIVAIPVLGDLLAPAHSSGGDALGHGAADTAGGTPATADGLGQHGDGIGAEAVLVELEP